MSLFPHVLRAEFFAISIVRGVSGKTIVHRNTGSTRQSELKILFLNFIYLFLRFIYLF